MSKEVHGMTYPVRAHLRALGGRWDPAQKCWVVPDARHAEALDVVRRQGPPSVNQAELIQQIRVLHYSLQPETPAAGCDLLSDHMILREAAVRQEIHCLEALLGRHLSNSEIFGN